MLTVTATAVAVAVLPAASLAEAVRVWEPLALVVVFHPAWKGAEVSGPPRGDPSRRNCTDVTPVSSVAFAVTVTVPDTDAPTAGEVIETVGCVVSPVTLAEASAEGALMFPAASWAVTR